MTTPVTSRPNSATPSDHATKDEEIKEDTTKTKVVNFVPTLNLSPDKLNPEKKPS